MEAPKSKKRIDYSTISMYYMGMFRRDVLREAIEMNGRTRHWLAGQCRIETQTINAYLSGKIEPSKPVAKLLSIVLEIPESDLWDETKEQAS
jgi:ribosome-binding protein aMBF1 (putative translation factor)